MDNINTNTILLVIILLGIVYIIYRKYDDDRKAKKNDRKNDQSRMVNKNYIIAHSNGVVPYYGYGYRRWYW
ncbi:MAG: hypothetical protein WD512_11890 [Candidatus Paceibacterota bacterium]